ncbi:mechanosensitive ion channel [Leucobacter viscericola]|uniref:Mechanosensitive ion channel n=1 Tax=Leucobacter viscericola TaxID=2714935 RepID=A0A6G7XBW7_9MICO|nr:mechanosensitive ion channel domain-containing protein [Leucobacter viscericola]QIK62053.1 mechanosensitive ion channel [Leucobacter viscericola]
MDWLKDVFNPDTISGWDALFSVLIIVAGLVIAHFAKKGVQSLAPKLPGLHPELLSLLARVTKYLIILVAIGVVLALLGANVQPLLATVILVGVVGFLALRGVASNFGAAVIIQSRRSIHLGQEIEVLGNTGVVKHLNSRAVVMETRDGRTIHVPNIDILNNSWINHSELGNRRSSVEVRVMSDAPVERVRELVESAARLTKGVLTSPEPVALTRSLSDRLFIFELRVWHAPLADTDVVSAMLTDLHVALKNAGYSSTVVWPVPKQPRTNPQLP